MTATPITTPCADPSGPTATALARLGTLPGKGKGFDEVPSCTLWEVAARPSPGGSKARLLHGSADVCRGPGEVLFYR
jgi:hypothetical protein